MSEGTPNPATCPMCRGPLAYGQATATRMRSPPSTSGSYGRVFPRPETGKGERGGTNGRGKRGEERRELDGHRPSHRRPRPDRDPERDPEAARPGGARRARDLDSRRVDPN